MQAKMTGLHLPLHPILGLFYGVCCKDAGDAGMQGSESVI